MKTRKDHMTAERAQLVEDLITAAQAFDEANAALAAHEKEHGTATHLGHASYGPAEPGTSPLESNKLRGWAREIEARGFSFD